jgi:hypothetical protein
MWRNLPCKFLLEGDFRVKKVIVSLIMLVVCSCSPSLPEEFEPDNGERSTPVNWDIDPEYVKIIAHDLGTPERLKNIQIFLWDGQPYYAIKFNCVKDANIGLYRMSFLNSEVSWSLRIYRENLVDMYFYESDLGKLYSPKVLEVFLLLKQRPVI